MPTRDIIVVGASTGGVPALRSLVEGLPAEFPAALFIVEHIPTTYESRLPDILNKVGAVPAAHARDGEPVEPGRIYVAPPDFHLLLESCRARLSRGYRENRFRPAIDPLFRTAARHYGARVIGVLLSGGVGDGIAGLMAVRNSGGVAVAQDPENAFQGDLPQEAIKIAGVDHIVTSTELPALLDRLVQQPSTEKGGKPMADPIEQLPGKVNQDKAAQENGALRGDRSLFSCPECGGALWQVDDQKLIRLRCHVGHAYYAKQLLADQADSLEAALWTAVRIFRDRATLSRQLAAQEEAQGRSAVTERFRDQAAGAEKQADSIQYNLLDKKTGIFSPVG